MKYCLLSYILFSFYFSAFAQEYRPLIDPETACSFKNPSNPVGKETNYFFVVEEMPSPVLSIKKIEKLLKEKVDFTKEESKIQDRIVFQTLVNCEGKAGDFQFLYCPVELKNICGQAIEVFMNEITDWQPGVQRSKNVDVLMKIEIIVDMGTLRLNSL